jgi:hypothetical protein
VRGSFLFNAVALAEAAGEINFYKDVIKIMLCTSAYEPDKTEHVTRAHVSNEVVGEGYAAGGKVVRVEVEPMDGDGVDIRFGQVQWGEPATITARRAVYYVARGGAPADDPLIMVCDFGEDASCQAGKFVVTESTYRRLL